MALGSVVVVGAGHGGFQLALSLRQGGFDGRLVLVGAEEGLPYQRPPLSKDYLAGTTGLDHLVMRPQAFYDDHRIELVGGTRVAAIDRPARQVRLEGGASLAYDHLVLATGARNRELAIPGAALEGVCALRTRAESERLRERLADARAVVVIGAGFIGLEFAAVAAQRQVPIDILELADRPMARVVTKATAAFFAEQHKNAGVTFHFGAQAARILGNAGRVEAVETASGELLPADLVLVSVGILPEDALAGAAGLAVANGVVVDAQLATADAAVSAIGDCALFPCRHAPATLERHAAQMLRLESVQNAVDQARCVADRLLGKPRAYESLPWFWSDQGELRLQIAGLTDGTTATALRGDPASGAFSVFCFAGDTLVGVESVNQPADHAAARRLLTAGTPITPAQAADPDFDLRAAARPRRPGA